MRWKRRKAAEMVRRLAKKSTKLYFSRLGKSASPKPLPCRTLPRKKIFAGGAEPLLNILTKVAGERVANSREWPKSPKVLVGA
jgi:hypothetical protein